MRTLRIPDGVWDWQSTLLVLAALVTPVLLVLQQVPDTRTLAMTAVVRSLVLYAAALVAAVFVYSHWRLTGTQAAAWLSLLMTVTAVHGLVLTTVSISRPEELARQADWLMVFQLALKAGLLALVLVSARIHLRVNPLLAGLLAGSAIAVVRGLVVTQAAPLHLPDLVVPTVSTLMVVLSLAIAAAVARMAGLAPWVRIRLALALVLIGIGMSVGFPTPDHLAESVVALSIGLLGALMLCTTTLAMLRLALQVREREIADLQHTLSEVEAGVRQDQARLHEIDSTVAGIASASRLIHGTPTTAAGLTTKRRDRLHEMLQAEVGRLERLMADRTPGERRSVRLDEVLGQIVALHRARGHAVAWESSGRRVLGRSDDVAEAVNILLENAARHGSAEHVRVDVLDRGATVEVAVSDDGPGVPAELAGRIFEWGVRHPVTGGQGIGLHIAAQLARDLGGDLRLDALHVTGDAGARFVLTLPADPQARTHEEVVAGAAHAAH